MEVKIRKIKTYDLVSEPGFVDAKLLDSNELERIRKEKLRLERKQKLEKLKWEGKH